MQAPVPRGEVPPAPGGAADLECFAVEAADGVRLRAGMWPAGGEERGVALLLPGRTEFLEKAAVAAAGLTHRGYRVVSLDWRGQGLSSRALPNGAKGHVGDFAEYERDLAALLAHPRVGAAGPADLVLGHSMGGTIALLARRHGLLKPCPMVLSAPMVEINVAPVVRRVVLGFATFARLTGQLGLWTPIRHARTAYPLATGFTENALTGDRAVWDWMVRAARAEPRFALAAPTLGWLASADRAMREVAEMGRQAGDGLVLYGSAEAVISQSTIRATAARLGFGLAEIHGARHEPLAEASAPRAAAWAAIDRFLGQLSPTGLARQGA